MMESDQTQQLQTNGEATQMMSAPDATQMVANVTCPVCKTDNPPSEQYCVDCGFLLSSTPVEVEQEQASVPGKLVEKSTGREFSLRIGENTVGRQSADVLLMDGTVSRAHAKVTLSPDKAVIEDMGSSNGTFVNGQQVQQDESLEAENGAEIKFGSAVLVLELAETPIAEAAETEESAEVTEEAEAAESPFDLSEEEVEEQAPESDEIEAAALTVSGRLVGLDETTGEYQVVFGENTIGRRAGNTIVISDPYVSGSHAVLSSDENGCRVTDVGSSNGTLINGEALTPNEPKELEDGDEVVFGRSKFRFELAGRPKGDTSSLPETSS